MAIQRKESIFVFDIETVPDHEIVYDLLDIERSENLTMLDVRKKLSEYHLLITDGRNDFPRQLFHKIVCISFLEARIDHEDGRESYNIVKFDSASIKNSTEEDLVKWFWDYVRKINPRFISFNGRMFDMPVLKYRALKYQIPCDWFFKSGDKWENYNQKYSLNWHMDLLDAFSDFGISAKIKMKEIASLLGIPCKLDGNGSSVTEMFDNGDIESIRDYCETDVLATYLLYLKYCNLSGILKKNSLLDHEKELEDFLKNNQKDKIKQFLLKWKK